MAITRPALLNSPWADTGDKLAPSNAELTAGWQNSPLPPGRKRFNWVFNWLTNASLYLLRRGISPWDATALYQTGDITVDTDGAIYQLAHNATVGVAPHLDRPNWGRLIAADGFGYQRSRRFEWQQFFVEFDSQTNANVKTYGPGVWTADGDGDGSVDTGLLGSSQPGGGMLPLARIDTPTAAGKYQRLHQGSANCLLTVDNVVSLECDVALDVVGSNGVDVYIGWGSTVLPWNTGSHPKYAMFVKPAGSSVWQTAASDGASVTTNTLAAAPVANTLQHLRIDWVGANRSADATSRLSFYVNGAPAGGISATLPLGAEFLAQWIAKENGASPTSRSLYFGGARFVTNTTAGDSL